MAKKILPPSVIAKKWGRNAGTAGQSLKEGIENVNESPMEAAAAKEDLYLQRIQEAVADGRYSRGLKKVSLAEWKDKTINKGVPRYQASIPGAIPKMEAAMNVLVPHIEEGQKLVQAMPSVTLEDGINRAAAMIRHMHKVKGKV